MERETLAFNEPLTPQTDNSTDVSQPQAEAPVLAPLQMQNTAQVKVATMSSPPPPPPAGPGGENNGQPINILMSAPLAER